MKLADRLGRLHIDSEESLGWATKISATFQYLDKRRQPARGGCKILVPPGDGPFPLYYQASYEIRDDAMRGLVSLGCLVVNPIAIAGTWATLETPVRRSINLDVALMHIARSINCVDDTRVIIGGGSAGGTATWMLTAETFPLAGSIPDVAQLNTGYVAWYLARTQALQEGTDPPLMPSVERSFRVGLAGPLTRHDCRSDMWFQHSPVAHLDAITSPVHALHATSDLLHPVDQIARHLRRSPIDMPEGYTTVDAQPWLFVEDVLPEVHIEPIPVPEDAVEQQLDGARVDRWMHGALTRRQSSDASAAHPQPGRCWVNLPDPCARVVFCVVQDGGPGPRLGHFRHAVSYMRGRFLTRVLSTPADAAAQLTPGKQRLLEARARGEEWIRTPQSHLDFPEAEKADVRRALAHVA